MKLSDADSYVEFIPSDDGASVFAGDIEGTSVHILLNKHDLARLSGYLERVIEDE